MDAINRKPTEIATSGKTQIYKKERRRRNRP
jgi:hypothetical protein